MINDIFIELDKEVSKIEKFEVGQFSWEDITETGGKWIDGKTIYRQVRHAINIRRNTGVGMNTSINGNIDSLVKLEAYIKTPNNIWSPCHQVSATAGNLYLTSEGLVNFSIDPEFYSDDSPGEIVIIIEFTKN